ncbi:leucyl/phenylalanyl-tRNA--protein transferase [Yeosuana sp. MJ-SS3]|uniref:Leucyl/phenylalanyl-tRNA--protein transferase n=1 Tax=Gilvirhabdus luticola TaxID=3079858 RepID=A0ABU3U3H6_9FLAO|nr:leucyl/phenylalanyl-tRNA--protein transferase [Yeosuana sp. MJ-SS3]MDU8884906.1 leucyl/phenylalanyl-tRNA--protein transferase [Yeosuana sp. MJ-SS3]
MQFLTKELKFPDVTSANKYGLLALGGDLSPERLLMAYRHGIFPWFNKDEVILWWSPDPRFVLFPEKLKISKSMKQVLRNSNYSITINKAFRTVIHQCASVKREGQHNTWITDIMIEAYITLHKLNYAKSVEVWKEKNLVAGFYGIDLNNGVFCGESMFTIEPNASKVGFINFIQNNNYKLIDCQVYTKHLESLGAENISRAMFLNLLN